MPLPELLTPIEWTPIPEVQVSDREALAFYVGRLLMDGTPFIACHPAAEIIKNAHGGQYLSPGEETIVDAIGAQPGWSIYSNRVVPAFTGLGQEKIGRLHNDTLLSIDDELELEDAQVTLISGRTGNGRIITGLPGTDFGRTTDEIERLLKGTYLPRTDSGWQTDPDHPHLQVLRDVVDPRVINPNMGYGRMEPGKTLAIWKEGKFGTWHRFDTDPYDAHRTIRARDISVIRED
jgi:hypothetical protein